MSIIISDHLPVFIIKKKEKEITKTTKFFGRSYVGYNKDLFQSDLRNHLKWNDFWSISDNDPDLLWECMEDIITEVVNFYCPYKKMKFRDDSPEWITKEIIAELAHKDYLYVQAKKTNSLENWSTL